MSKKVRTLLIGAIILVALGIITVVLLLLPAPSPEESLLPASSPDAITIASQPSDQLDSATIKNADDEYTIALVGENLWRIPEIQDFPANEGRYVSVRNDLCTVSAMQVVEENSQKLADYGLRPPAVEVSVHFKDGTSYSLGLGNMSPDGSRRYAIRLDEDTNTVYGLASTTLTTTSLTRNDFLDTSLTPAVTAEDGSEKAPEINYLNITASYLEKPITVEEITESDPDFGKAMDTLKMTSPVRSLLDGTWMQNNILTMFGVSARRVVKTNPTEGDLTAYGLDSPYMTFEIRYEGTSSFKLLVGHGLDEEGNPTQNKKDVDAYYVMKEGTELVYLADALSLPWVGVQPRQVIMSLVTLPNISTVDSIILILDGQEHILKVTQTPSSDPEKADDPTQNEYAFTLDGEEVDEDMAKKFYQLLLSTSVEDVNEQEPSSAVPTMSITYRLLDGTSDRVDFYVDSDLRTIVSLNGNNAYIGRSGLIDKMRKELMNLQNGETVSPDW